MTATPLTDRLRAVAEPAVTSAGLFLEELTLTPIGRRRLLRVIVDLAPEAIGGVPVDTVAEAARLVSEALDSSEVMGDGPYLLEVSSPGVDRPLTQRRHWLRARGRLVRANLADGSQTAGRLTGVDDDGVLIGGRVIGWELLSRGQVEIEFNRPDAEPDAEPDPQPTEGSA